MTKSSMLKISYLQKICGLAVVRGLLEDDDPRLLGNFKSTHFFSCYSISSLKTLLEMSTTFLCWKSIREEYIRMFEL